MLQTIRNRPIDRVLLLPFREEGAQRSWEGRLFKHNRKAFTLIEVLVAAALVGIAVVAVFGAMRVIGNTSVKAATSDKLQRLAQEKMADIAILTSPTANGTDGDFSDRGEPDATYNIDDVTTSVTNMDEVTVTVTEGKDSQALTTLMFIPPATTISSTGTTQ